MLKHITRSISAIVLFMLVPLIFTGCATTQQQGTQQQGQQGQENFGQQQQGNNTGNGNAANFNNGGNVTANSGGNGQNTGNNQFANSQGGQAVNNAEDEDFGEQNAANFGGQGNAAANTATQGQGNPTTNNYGMNMNTGGNSLDNNLAGNEQLTQSADPMAQGNGGEGVNNALPSEEEFAQGAAGANPAGVPAVDAPVTDNTVTEIVDQAATPPDGVTGTDAMPAQPSMGMGYNPGGIVKYIREGGGSMYSQPALGGPAVGTLEQGDHPLVFQEADWARTHDGYYIPMSQLSDKGVPRPRYPSVWR